MTETPEMADGADAADGAKAAGATDQLRRRALRRAAEDPFFVGFALALYRDGENLDDAALARRLGCSPPALPRLALCRRPASTNASFEDDAAQIAAYAHADVDRFVNVLRYAENVEALRRATPRAGAGGVLLAARDVDPLVSPDPQRSVSVDEQAGSGQSGELGQSGHPGWRQEPHDA